PAPTAPPDRAEGREGACPRRSMPQSATSHKRRGYLVMKGSAVRIRASAFIRASIGTGFRHRPRHHWVQAVFHIISFLPAAEHGLGDPEAPGRSVPMALRGVVRPLLHLDGNRRGTASAW